MIDMHIRKQLLPALGLALVAHAGCVAASAADDPAPSSKQAPAVEKRPEADLKVGMPSAAVTQLMGKPDSVSPMKTQAGKAEVWAYQRQLNDRVEQIEAAIPIMVSVPGPNNTSHLVPGGEKVEVRQMHHITTEVVELLMFNGHFVTQKVSHKERQETY